MFSTNEKDSVVIKFYSFRMGAILITDGNTDGNLTLIGWNKNQSIAGLNSTVTINKNTNTATVKLTKWSDGIIIGRNIKSISYA